MSAASSRTWCAPAAGALGCCYALQIALAGNCVYEQTGQGSTQDTRQRAADIASVPSTGKRQLPPLPHTSTVFASVSCCSLATPYDTICWRCSAFARPHSSIIFMPSTRRECDQLQGAQRDKGKKWGGKGKRLVGVAFGNCKCNHKTYHYMTRFKLPAWKYATTFRRQRETMLNIWAWPAHTHTETQGHTQAHTCTLFTIHTSSIKVQLTLPQPAHT